MRASTTPSWPSTGRSRMGSPSMRDVSASASPAPARSAHPASMATDAARATRSRCTNASATHPVATTTAERRHADARGAASVAAPSRSSTTDPPMAAPAQSAAAIMQVAIGAAPSGRRSPSDAGSSAPRVPFGPPASFAASSSLAEVPTSTRRFGGPRSGRTTFVSQRPAPSKAPLRIASSAPLLAAGVRGKHGDASVSVRSRGSRVEVALLSTVGSFLPWWTTSSPDAVEVKDVRLECHHPDDRA